MSILCLRRTYRAAAARGRVIGCQWAFILVLISLWPAAAGAFEPFVVEEIRVEGLKRITEGTVFSYLPISIGDRVDEARSAEAVRALFKTGFFSDVRLSHEDGVLLVSVVERPSIANLTISGNKDISTEQLTTALEKIGLAKGHVFDRSALDKVEREIQRQYFSEGKFGIRVESEVKQLDDGRVDIAITLYEGGVSRIKRILLVGNKTFSSEELLGEFQLQSETTFALFGKNDQYSKQRLSGDLEALRSYYLDRGYINFNIDSTRVSISPDKRDVYVTITVSEGEQYRIKDVHFAGDLVVDEQELRGLLQLAPGEIFSRRKVADTAKSITERLGEEGYAFANVNPIPEVDKENKEVSLTLFIDPAKRVYVRRINITGNVKSRDDVLRREIRQLESAWLSTDRVSLSKVRLQRLGFFEDVNVETVPVSGSDDLVDLNFNVAERANTGTLLAGIGYSQDGFLFNFSVNMNNFLGTGKQVGVELNNSKVNTIYSFSYVNPYYKPEGVSRTIKAYVRNTDASQANVADYTTDVYGGELSFGLPLTEEKTLRLGVSYEHSDIATNLNTPTAILDFLAANGDVFDVVKGVFGWTYDSRDRAFFATTGLQQRFSAEVAVPTSGLEYYKLTSRTRWYTPLVSSLTLLLRADLGVGDSYGDTTALPFFEHFYAGGGQSVRGFRANTLGPRESNKPLGGALKVVGNAEVMFSPPFAGKNKSLRTSLFFDIGNVFEDASTFEADELRYSAGAALYWFSPIGPFTISLAQVFNDQLQDETERFQFSLGTAF